MREKKPYPYIVKNDSYKMDVQRHMDGWSNIQTQVNVVGKDKNTAASVGWGPTVRPVAEALFSGDDIAGKIAKIIPYDATREGITWNISGRDENEDDVNDVIKSLNTQFEDLGIFRQFAWCWTMARVYGGAVCLISLDDGMELDEPINPGRVRKINTLQVFDRWDLHVETMDIISDLSSPMFGLPEFYTYQGNSIGHTNHERVRIHHSRIIRFDGEALPRNLWRRNNYWSDSIYGKLYNAIRNYSTSHDIVATIMQEINQPIFRIEGLHEAVSQDEDELIIKRLNTINQLRSTVRAIVLDKEDEFANMQSTLPGIKDMLNIGVNRLVAASDIPHTLLLGESPGASLGEQGKSERTDYYDTIKARQEITLRPAIDRITEIIFMQIDPDVAISEPDEWTYEFDPLFQQDQKEIIETRKIQADIDNVYMTSGVYDSFEVAENRFGTGEYSYETSIEEKDRAEFQPTDPEQTMEAEAPGAAADMIKGTEADPLAAQVEKGGAKQVNPEAIVSEVDPSSLLNGAQVTAILSIVEQVSAGTLNKSTASALIKQSFGMSEEQVGSILDPLVEGENKAQPQQEQLFPEEKKRSQRMIPKSEESEDDA